MRTSEGASTDPLVGVVLDGRYELVERVARGGMATVYRADDQRLQRWVAVKVMHPGFAEDPEFVARFTREARSAASLSAPEVVAVYDQGHDRDEGLVYLVMELVPGRDLRALLRERGSLTPAQALSIMEPVLQALSAAHSAGLVHRDVKPENVLLGDDGRVKVADFGLARAVQASRHTTATGIVMGTVAYVAPEQVETGLADPRTDVYAAGIVLWELLVGEPPVSGESPINVLYKHVNHDVPSPAERLPDLPEALADLVVRATRRRPDERPGDGAAFLAEVRALRGQLDGSADPRELLPLAGHDAGEGVADSDDPSHTQQVPRQHTLVVDEPRRDTPAGDVSQAPPATKRKRGAQSPDDQPRRNRRRGLIATAVILVLGLVAGVSGWWFASGRYTSAPAVVNLEEQAARTTLQEAGFTVRIDPERAFSEEVARGSVVDQDPDADDRLLRGGTVTLILSRGPERFTVPTVAGLAEADARAEIAAQNLVVAGTSLAFSQTVPEGAVIAIDPAAGESVKRDTPVSLIISKGVEPLDVPTDLAGREREDAVEAVEDAGFVAEVVEVFDENVSSGDVVATAPSSGQAGRGSTITISVSKGPEPRIVPNLIGLPAGEAREALEALGLQARLFCIFCGREVIRTDPAAGTQVERGTRVTLLVD